MFQRQGENIQFDQKEITPSDNDGSETGLHATKSGSRDIESDKDYLYVIFTVELEN